MIDRFNVRVYGLVLNEQNQVLVSDEQAAGMHFTKFPGGGLEYGEGIIDCLHREFKEELEAKINVLEHFHTTEEFVQSAFRKKDQIISIYYLIELLTDSIPKERPSDKETGFRWIAIHELDSDIFRFPIDKKVAGLLKSRNSI